MNHDELHGLMMAAIDGEIDDAGLRRLEALLEASPEARREYEAMKQLNQTQQTMRLVEPTRQAWRQFERGLIARLVYRPLHVGGMILVVAGLLCLLGFGLYELTLVLWKDDQMPQIVRFGIAAVAAGVLALFASVLIYRLVTLPADKYSRKVNL